MVIIGYSGTGKSVAIKHIVGLLEPDSGQVDRRRPRGAQPVAARALQLRARIGYVFQFAALFDSFTIGENVAMGLRKQQELTEREIARSRARSARPRRPAERRRPISRRAVGRHAQARRHRARHRAPPEVHPVRRADHRPRSRSPAP